MKGLLSLIALFVCLLASGQAANQVFATDSTHGDENIYFTGTKEAGIYQGIAGFIFQSSHDDATAYLQGCYNTDNWHNVDTLSISGASAVNRFMFEAPPKYKYYRLWVDGSAGDTCIIKYARYILKY